MGACISHVKLFLHSIGLWEFLMHMGSAHGGRSQSVILHTRMSSVQTEHRDPWSSSFTGHFEYISLNSFSTTSAFLPKKNYFSKGHISSRSPTDGSGTRHRTRVWESSGVPAGKRVEWDEVSVLGGQPQSATQRRATRRQVLTRPSHPPSF